MFIIHKTFKMKQFKHAVFLLVIIFVTGCGPSTKLINSWSDKENTPKKFDKIGVAVLFPDNSNRYITERAIVDKLKERGINAVPTYDIFPFAGRMGELMKNDGKSNPEAIKKIVVEKVTENKFDGFMIVTVFDKKREERWVNDPGIRGGMGYYGTPYAVPGTYYDFYYYTMDGIYNDGHYVDQVTYFLECNLYDVKSEKLIWRAQTKSVDVASMDDETQRLGEIVAYQLKTKKIVE